MGAAEQPRLTARPCKARLPLPTTAVTKRLMDRGQQLLRAMKQGPLLHPVLLPALLAHSDLAFLPLLSSPSTNHQVLVHLWGFIPGHQEKAPNHSTSERIQVLSLLPSLVSQRFSFYPLSVSLPLRLFFFKDVHSKTQSGHNTPVVCHPTVLPADLFLCAMCLFQLVCKPLREDI